MKTLINQSQIDYFKENGHIEFEEVFSKERLQALRASALSQKKNMRDLFRRSDVIRRTLLSKSIASIATALAEKPSLQLAFDQLLLSEEPSEYTQALAIEEMGSIQGMEIAMIINLGTDESILPFPTQPGNVMFLSPKLTLDFPELSNLPGQEFLVVCFVRPKSRYRYTELDPHNHSLKKLGYSYGDALNTTYHPILSGK